MTPTTSDKVKEIIESWERATNHAKVGEWSVDIFLSTPEGSRLIAGLEEGQDWISVEDRLPEIPPKYYDKDDEAYITPCNINVLVWDGENVYEKSFGIINWDKDITHWQPLPEPPKIN